MRFHPAVGVDVTQQTTTYVFGGGYDLSTTPLAMSPGKLMSGINYEPISEGYGRVDGFERFDGKPAPSAAKFWLLLFANGVQPFVIGSRVKGQTSGAEGTLVAAPFETTGETTSASFAGRLILIDVVGDFADDEVLFTTAGGIHARAEGPAVEDDGDTEAQRRIYLETAQTFRRSAIGRVPGSGPVRGVAVFDNVVYAWRDNLAETAGVMWKSTATGWQAIAVSRIVRFTAGVREIFDGDRITGALSGAQATAWRVVRQQGNWGATAAGYIVLTAQVGTFAAEDILTTAMTAATVTPDVAQPFAKGGRYMTIAHNFYGASNRRALYGAYGEGRAFELREGVISFVETGMVDDRPTRIFEISQHLGLTYRGGSVQFSRPGEPFIYDVVVGAGEIGLGTDVTDVIQATETTVTLFGKEKIAILSGRDVDTFQLDELTEEAGADAWTAQRIARTIYLDARGLRDLAATQAFGNYRAGSLLERVYPYFKSKRAGKNVPVASWVSKTKSQYRLLWNDGTGLTVYMGRKEAEAIPFSTGEARFSCVATGEYDGVEAIFAGSDEGYVYRLDSGTSFDGVGIKGFILPAFNHIGAPRNDKQLFRTVVELDAEPLTRIGITVIFDYGDGQQPESGSREFTIPGATGHNLLVEGGGGIWDTAIWNEFFWSAPIRGRASADTEGIGLNMAPLIACASTPTEARHILQTYTLHWSPRRLRRD